MILPETAAPRHLTCSSVRSSRLRPLATDPDPLNTSTANDPVTGRLDITVQAKPGDTPYCNKITVKLRTGTGANAFTDAPNDITTAVIGGSAPDQGGGWTARPSTEGTWRVFEFTPARPPQFKDWSITLVISRILINETPGNADIRIIESSSPTNSDYTAKTTDTTLTKYPNEFGSSH
ncbi:hypothetical protein [Streptomyces sp. NPDC059874]|uniref:hypothetical protein n=1 Tax=Streptomyces sp. NPDC059874 TaxID=3346983 RepID=UPI003665DA84